MPLLAAGESVTVTIFARQKWNNTGVDLVAGQHYACTARGTWVDWTIPSTADGYESENRLTLRLTEWLRRAPRENWFALMGEISGDPGHPFLIGQSRVIKPQTSGTLLCFANDLSLMYWNNHGSVELTITLVTSG